MGSCSGVQPYAAVGLQKGTPGKPPHKLAVCHSCLHQAVSRCRAGEWVSPCNWHAQAPTARQCHSLLATGYLQIDLLVLNTLAWQVAGHCLNLSAQASTPLSVVQAVQKQQ